MKKYLISLFFVLVFVFTFVPPSAGLAQVSEVTATDLGVAKPTLLPTSPFYFFKEATRGVRLFFTFNSVRKVELELKFADEKVIEAKEVVEQGPENKAALERAVENYQNAAARVKVRIEGLRETSQNPNVDRLLDKLADRTIKHGALFDELKTKTEVKGIDEKLDTARNKLGEGLLKAADRIEDPDKLVRRVKRAVDEYEVRGELEQIRKVEFFDHIEKNAGDDLKEKLRGAREDFLGDIQHVFEEKFKEKPREEVAEELKGIPGDAALRAKIITELKLRAPKEHEKSFGHLEEELSEDVKRQEDRDRKAEEQIREAGEKISELERRVSEHPDRVNEAVKRHLLEAREKLARAKDVFQKGDFGEAFGQANSAEALARAGLRLMEEEREEDEGFDTENLKQEMADLENKIQRYSEFLKGRGWTEENAPEAYRLLNEARKHLGFARDAFAKSDFKGTILHIGHVKDWLRDLSHLIAKETGSVGTPRPEKREERPIACPSLSFPACERDRSSDECARQVKGASAKYPNCGFEKHYEGMASPSRPASEATARPIAHCEDIRRNLSELDNLLSRGEISKEDYARKHDIYQKELNACEAQTTPPLAPKPTLVPPAPKLIPEPTSVCTREYAPVCGVNGKTYSNACHAKVAGIAVKYRGECGKPDTEGVLEKVNPPLPIPDTGVPPAPPPSGTTEKLPLAPIAPTPPPPAPLLTPTTSAVLEPISFKVEADDAGFYPTNILYAVKGSKVTITFFVRERNVYYGGLDFRSPKFKTDSVKPGGSTHVEFTADESFVITSYWPASGVRKADLKIELK